MSLPEMWHKTVNSFVSQMLATIITSPEYRRVHSDRASQADSL